MSALKWMRRLALAITAAGGLAAIGCTSMGYGFDDPEGELSLVGDLTVQCRGGLAFYYGAARNTGDADVQDAIIIIDVFNSGGGLIGRYPGPISQTVEEETLETPTGPVDISIVDDALAVDESGSFAVQTDVGCGAAARAEVSFSFTVPPLEGG